MKMRPHEEISTPKEGWSAYEHHLGNRLIMIGMAFQGWKDADTDEERTEEEIRIKRSLTELVGALYLIKVRMKVCGHQKTVEMMQEILDMVVTSDLQVPNVRATIHQKFEELAIV